MADEYKPPTDEEIEALAKMEGQVYGTGEGSLTPKQLTKKILSDAGPTAAMTIAHLAKSASNENTRLRAAQYIADTVLENDNGDGKLDPLEDMAAKFTELIDGEKR
jgi:hypothetical protein